MDRRSRRLFTLGVLALLPLAVVAQTRRSQAGTLTIAGQQEQAPLVRMNGKSYVDVESLARLTGGALRYQGSRIILTLPLAANGVAASSAAAEKTPKLSAAFLAAEVEAMTAVRDWRISLVNAVQNNYPVAEDWVGRLQRSADAKLQMAAAAASTAPDQMMLELIRNQLVNMQQESDQFVAMHTRVNFTPTDSFENNALDQKIVGCDRALAQMAAAKQFQDEPACH